MEYGHYDGDLIVDNSTLYLAIDLLIAIAVATWKHFDFSRIETLAVIAGFVECFFGRPNGVGSKRHGLLKEPGSLGGSEPKPHEAGAQGFAVGEVDADYGRWLTRKRNEYASGGVRN